jgi:multidrug efflux pump
MMSRFFIDRPIFAWVIAILIMLLGALAVHVLPIAQYPSIAPPAISITGTYPGASSETVESTVVQVIEQQLSGIDNLLYFNSESDKDGSLTITLYFRQGTNADIAQVQVQNKLQLATPELPQVVQQQGLRVAKSTRNFLVVVGLVSPDDRLNNQDISDLIVSRLQDPLSRTVGVGDYQVFGTQYAMRIWLDPGRLNSYSLTPLDVASAISDENVQVTAGELGGLPSVKDQQLNATIVGPTRLSTPAEFRKILLRVNQDGSQVRLQDVARVELAGESAGIDAAYNGHPAAGIAIKLAPGANALDTVTAVHATMDKLAPTLPPGLQVIYPYDTTPFIRISVEEVVKTLLEAIVLVFLVMYLFLQNLRATLVPTIAVPVVLLGTFGVLAAFGYSINTLTLFGMVLAIGLLVDDAIVVVENVERLMHDEKLSPKAATRKSMEEITGALVGIALVLSAVFLPMAFFGGSTGVIYRQFSITIASSMILSVLVALTFTPALCATILKPSNREAQERRGFFGWFNRSFDRANRQYERAVQGTITRSGRAFVFYAILLVILAVVFIRLPSSFLPDEDQGILFLQVTTPPGATVERTGAVLGQVRDYVLHDEKDAVEGLFTVTGFNFSGRGQNSGLAFIRLKPWDQRSGARLSAQAVAGRIMGRFAKTPDALVFALVPPAVFELGNATGFDMELVDRANIGHQRMVDARNQLLGMASKEPTVFAVRPNGLNDEPQYHLKIDKEKARALGLSLGDIDGVLADAWGSEYVNDFLDRGRVKRVFIQGDAQFRMDPKDIARWYVRNSGGGMVPFSAFTSGSWGFGSPKLERYNGSSSFEIQGQPAPGQSTGTAMDTMARLANQLPAGVGFEWTGLSYEEVLSGSQAPALYAISLIVVFLCLAALYESWSIPFAVMLVVPLGVLGAVLVTWFRGLNNDVFFQVGLLTTIGLSTKNAILIVEFAKKNYEDGMKLIEATVHAAHQRLRPILMTSLAFMLGVMPLAVSTGAGSGGRIAIGTGVVGGMLTATVLAVFLVPVFFVVVLTQVGYKTQSEREDLENQDSKGGTASTGEAQA